MKLTKILLILSLALVTSEAKAQSAKEILSVISSFPTEKEILAQLNTNTPFEAILKGLNEKIDKYDKAINNTEETLSENSQKRMEELGIDENTTQESMLSNMNVSKDDLEALEKMDDNNPAKIALAKLHNNTIIQTS